jgi:hypothetical protein
MMAKSISEHLVLILMMFAMLLLFYSVTDLDPCWYEIATLVSIGRIIDKVRDWLS